MCVEFTSKGIDDARTVILGIGALQRGYDYMIERASIPNARNWGYLSNAHRYWYQYQMKMKFLLKLSSVCFSCMRQTVQVD